LPVHNALPHLDSAIKSILAQTFGDFEFVILDDASTDGSSERLREWAARDDRIRLIHSNENLGPARSSERVARTAAAPIVARMDADDIAYPTCLAEEYAVLEKHPDVGLVGSLCDTIDASGNTVRSIELWRLADQSFLVPFGHSLMMYRRSVFESVGGYRPECDYWEDQDLVLRMSKICRIMVIPKALTQMRQWAGSSRVASAREQREQALQRMYRCLALLERGEPYDELLAAPADTRSKLDPRVFVSMGLAQLWAGETPHLFRRLLKRGNLGPNAWSFLTLGWTALATTSPAALRAILRLILRARALRADGKVPTGAPLIWEPGRGTSKA
jgi:hypothetical protein